MTAPALLMLANCENTDANALVLSRLRCRLHELRHTVQCQTAFVRAGQPSITASLRTLAKQGYAETVCVPLEAARLSDADPRLVARFEAGRQEVPDMRLTLASPLGAPGSLFSLLDRRLHDALAALGQRELDSLVLLHDSGFDHAESAQLGRRARVWAAHHRLPVTVASLSSPSAVQAALAVHGGSGRRHVGVAWLSVFDDEGLRWHLARDPRVAAVAAPLGDDDAVVDTVAAQYSVAALRSLDEIAQAS